jgi:acyl carrier protein
MQSTERAEPAICEEKQDVAGILATVSSVLRELLESDGAPAPIIEMTTRLASDLELESIELIALAERLAQHYRVRLNFATWLSRKSLRDILGLTVGDVVHFVAASLDDEGAARRVEAPPQPPPQMPPRH